jgi:murein L,D-transpeptidase YafK
MEMIYRILKNLGLIIFLLPVFISPKETPSSARSREVISRQKLLLEKTLKEKGLKFGSPVFIRILKQSGLLELWVKDNEKYKLFKSYEICYYSGTIGPKEKKGDCQSPEGFYQLTPNRLNPNSSFYLSFDVGYPNSYDKYHNRTGSAIAVHGHCCSIGCFAMTNPFIEEIYTLVDAAFRNGQDVIAIHIFPFYMTDKSMEKYKDSKWINFWKELKPGFDFFEINNTPPKISVINCKYVIK